MDDEKNKALVEFSRNRQQLMNVSNQKQRIQFQLTAIDSALKELNEGKDDKVFKIVGPIMVEKKSSDLKKELKKEKETFELRAKTVDRQEELLIKSLNKLKSKIEAKDKK